MARCVEDYARYRTFPWNIIYPNEMKLKGHRIIVRLYIFGGFISVLRLLRSMYSGLYEKFYLALSQP